MKTPHPVPDFLAEWGAQSVQRRGAPIETQRFVRDVIWALQTAVTQGHTCIHLRAEEAERLLALPIAGVLEQGAARPLVVDAHQRLYWHRYAHYEVSLARAVACRLLAPVLDSAEVDSVLALLWPGADPHHAQNRAIRTGLTQSLTLVSGGPGTGKTSLTVRLLKALLTLRPDERVALAAPTGKAAHRMMQAIEEKIGDWPPSLLERLPKTAQTLHRLIGTPMYGVTPKFHQGHPLPIDYLVIDEASMMDLSLASRVFDALPPSCRVLLLGDKNQLSSVESGAVFAELMASSSRPFAAESAHVIELTESYRFTETSGIGRLADAVREGNTTAALALLKAPACTALDVRLQAPLGTRPSPDELAGLASPYADYWALMAQEKMRSTDEVLHAFDRYRVLCALEVGPWGARHLGLELDELFRARAGRGGALWYPGRAIMITRNDPELGLVNGEIGIARETPTGDLRVEFMSLAETPRSFAPQRLAHFAVAYAITIHKSQGSELDEVTVVLPYDDSPMLTRELLYTAITRARRQVVVIAKEAAVESAILTPTLRLSGLRDRIQDVMENRI